MNPSPPTTGDTPFMDENEITREFGIALAHATAEFNRAVSRGERVYLERVREAERLYYERLGLRKDGFSARREWKSFADYQV